MHQIIDLPRDSGRSINHNKLEKPVKNLLIALLATFVFSSAVMAQAKPDTKKEATKATQSQMKSTEMTAEAHEAAAAAHEKAAEHHKMSAKHHRKGMSAEAKAHAEKAEKASATAQAKTTEAVKHAKPEKVAEKPVQKKK